MAKLHLPPKTLAKAQVAECYTCTKPPFDWPQFFRELICIHHDVPIIIPDEIKLRGFSNEAVFYECHRCGKDMTMRQINQF